MTSAGLEIAVGTVALLVLAGFAAGLGRRRRRRGRADPAARTAARARDSAPCRRSRPTSSAASWAPRRAPSTYYRRVQPDLRTAGPDGARGPGRRVRRRAAGAARSRPSCSSRSSSWCSSASRPTPSRGRRRPGTTPALGRRAALAAPPSSACGHRRLRRAARAGHRHVPRHQAGGVLGYAFLPASAIAKIVNFATNLGALAVFFAAGRAAVGARPGWSARPTSSAPTSARGWRWPRAPVRPRRVRRRGRRADRPARAGTSSPERGTRSAHVARGPSTARSALDSGG